MNTIRIDLERPIATIDRNIFGGFLEHFGRAVYGGVYEPGSPLADEQGLRTDVLNALRRLKFSNIRYPGGNFVSGYRWRDGIGPIDQRPARPELAWHTVETNHFGTDEFIQFCRQIDSEPYLVVNCGDGDMREARDWVEYCNGTADTALVKLRRANGFEAPHRVKYWGVGNEVDGHWQIGYKTPQEYARAYTEFAKTMRWVDPEIKLLAAAFCHWEHNIVERTQLLLEQAGDLIDYLSVHWYVGNREDDFLKYMTLSELLEARLTATEGLIDALKLDNAIQRDIAIAVDEWNISYRPHVQGGVHLPEENYNLEDALVIAMHLNAFIRHARSVKMANIAQIVNSIAPIFTREDGLFLETIFYPFELFSQHCGPTALDVFWQGDTFSGGTFSGVRVLDVSATLDEARRQMTVFVVNRSPDQALETTISLTTGAFAGPVTARVVNGPDIKAVNGFETPDGVVTRETMLNAQGRAWTYAFEPHSVTALTCAVS
ncbi:MAG: alpha-N-arabinofuranosidase [Anaerolineae bacterium]|nr:alpha-N-arabinofuranosidase [Anaerolineae bacterium]